MKTAACRFCRAATPVVAVLATLAAGLPGVSGEEKRAPASVAVTTDLGHDLSDAFALAYLVAHPQIGLKLVKATGDNALGSARILRRLFWLAEVEPPIFSMASSEPAAGPPDSSGLFQFGLRPSSRNPPKRENGQPREGRLPRP